MLYENDSYPLYSLALEAIASGELPAAEELLRRSVALEHHSKAHRELAKLLRLRACQDEAKHHFEQAYRADPENQGAATDEIWSRVVDRDSRRRRMIRRRPPPRVVRVEGRRRIRLRRGPVAGARRR